MKFQKSRYVCGGMNYRGLFLMAMGLLVSLYLGLPVCAEEAAKPDQAVVLAVPPALSLDTLDTLKKRMGQARDAGVKTFVFRFSGRGRSFDAFGELGREILLQSQRHQVRTVAYIPKEALGMSLLGVLACREIVADDFAQLGQVEAVMRMPAEDQDAKKDKDKEKDKADQETVIAVDSQNLVNKIVTLAQAAGHDPLLAEAMARKGITLYRMVKGDEYKFADQKDFEQLSGQSKNPWKMVGNGPIVQAGELLLLSGRQAKEFGLVNHLAVDEKELAQRLAVEMVDVRDLAAKTEKSDKPANPVEKTLGLPEGDAVKKAQDNLIRSAKTDNPPKATVIIIDGTVDEGLYESIKRRTQIALDGGATTIIYQVDTFGGLVYSGAIPIWKYFMQDVARKAHTVAYIPTEAISAGAMISVACRDVIMRHSSKIGDCAPISPGDTIKGVEREKQESPLRSYFEDAARTNGYPIALCKAMVTVGIEVYQIKNHDTGEYEYFEGDQLPTDAEKYDLANKKRIDKDSELVTLTAPKALEYGIARAVVDDLEGVLKFIESRDGVTFPRPAAEFKTNWSEELVRWLTSPTVAGILMMIAMLGIYMEFNTPGAVLPGVVAVIALAIVFGSKYLIGMANWWEIMIFAIGLILLMVEIFVIPGFGVFGIAGIVMMLFGLGAMMVGNRPDELPLPKTDMDWSLFEKNLTGMLLGVVGFFVGAFFISKYVHKIPFASRLMLNAVPDPACVRGGVTVADALGTVPEDSTVTASIEQPSVQPGQQGKTLTDLRPAGRALIEGKRLDVVSQGQMIDAHKDIVVVLVEGNRVVVKEPHR